MWQSFLRVVPSWIAGGSRAPTGMRGIGLRGNAERSDNMNPEVERLLKSLFEYASSKREEGIFGMTEILGRYHRDVLVVALNPSGIAKRFASLVKEFVGKDPRYQSRIDQYATR